MSQVMVDRYRKRIERLKLHVADVEEAIGRRNATIQRLGQTIQELSQENSELRKTVETFDSRGFADLRDEVFDLCGHLSIQLEVDDDCFDALSKVWDRLKRTQFAPRVDTGSPSEPNNMESARTYVLAGANGKFIGNGDHVWCVATDDELLDMSIGEGSWPEVRRELTVKTLVSDMLGNHWATFEETSFFVLARYLTKTKPEEPDTWERIEEDALSFVEDNAGILHDQDQMERDMLAILRRCKALAERSE